MHRLAQAPGVQSVGSPGAGVTDSWSHPVWLLGAQLRSPERAVRALQHRAISPALATVLASAPGFSCERQGSELKSSRLGGRHLIR